MLQSKKLSKGMMTLKLKHRLALKLRGQHAIGGQLREEVEAKLEQYKKSGEAKGLDNLGLQMVIDEMSREAIVDDNLAQTREMYDKTTRKQLKDVQFSMAPGATKKGKIEGANAASKLRDKLKSEYVGEDVVSGQLSNEVKAMLQLYDTPRRLLAQG